MSEEQTAEEKQAAEVFAISERLKEEFPDFFSSATEKEIQELIRARKVGQERKWKHTQSSRQGSDGIPPANYTGLADVYPLPGIEHTFVWYSKKDTTVQYGIYGGGMYPQSTLVVPDTGKTVEVSTPEFDSLEDAVDGYETTKTKEVREKSERARLVLEALHVWGQSISASKSGEALTKTGEPRKAYGSALVSITKYGLWSRYENNTLHIGDFAKSGVMTVTAGDHWQGYAAVCPPNPSLISVTVADRARSFVPPAEMVYVVPNDAIKYSLVSALRATSCDFSKLPFDTFIADIIFTHDEVLAGKLTDYVTTHFSEEKQKDPV